MLWGVDSEGAVVKTAGVGLIVEDWRESEIICLGNALRTRLSGACQHMLSTTQKLASQLRMTPKPTEMTLIISSVMAVGEGHCRT